MFYMIQNQARFIPTVNMITTLGVSSSRDLMDTIGMFGSGFKNALALFARTLIEDHKLFLEECKMCLGKDVYTFEIKFEDAQDSNGVNRKIGRIMMKHQGGRTYDLNIGIGFGALDWKNLDMGLREIVSNAIDGQIGYDNKPTNIVIQPTEHARAKDGFIRFYVPVTPETETYFDRIKEHFICLTLSYNKDRACIPKYTPGPARIYKKGVKVGEFGKNSLYDYNLNDLNLKESRNVDNYEAQSLVAKAIVNNSVSLTKYLATERNPEYYENTIPSAWFSPNHYWGEEETNTIKENYKKAFRNVYGDMIACCHSNQITQVESTGRAGVLLSEEVYKAMVISGVPSAKTILTEDQLEGREVIELDNATHDIFNIIWNKLVELKMTDNKEKPKLMGFRQILKTDSIVHGRYQNNTVYLNVDFLGGFSSLNTMLHELGHHITEADDCSRAFEEFFCKTATKLMCI